MKKFVIPVLCVTILLLIALSVVILRRGTVIPEGAVKCENIVSYCVGDVTNDGIPEALIISGIGEIDTGERHGQLLLVCDASVVDKMYDIGYIPLERIVCSIDLTGIKPLKVQIGDINGDGVNEVAICVYKTAKFHEVMAKRPFFFDLVEGNLIPVWLGSRLSRPFDDYILFDINEDGLDEVISIEHTQNGNRIVAVYIWKGFGFEMLTESAELDAPLQFDTEPPRTSGNMAEIGIIKGKSEKLIIAFSVNENEG